jgi:hypothetical protein
MDPVHLGSEADIAQPVVDKLIYILRDDAHNHKALQADFRTVGNIVVLGVDHGIFKKTENANLLSVALGNQVFLNALMAEIESNSSMSALLPEFTNMAFRSIANSLNVPGGDQEAYTQMMGSLTTSLNDVKGLSKEERTEKLTQDLEKALTDAGVAVAENQKDILSQYADDMATELIDNSDKDTITEEDIQMFLATHVPTTGVPQVPAP